MNKEDRENQIAVIIPTLNEAGGIDPTISELRCFLRKADYIVIDGQSTDATREIAHNLGARVIIQSGKGKGQAIAEALKAINPDMKYLVLTDGDYTYPAICIPDMINTMNSDTKVGMVCGNRFSDLSNIRRIMEDKYYYGNKILAFVHRIFNDIVMKDPFTGLRLVRFEAIREWKPKSKGFDIEAELNIHIKRGGYEIVEIPIPYRLRLGKKKLSMKHGFQIVKRILFSAFSQ